jgi:hypothetical protein
MGGALARVSGQDPQHRPPPYCDTVVADELEADGEAADAVPGNPKQRAAVAVIPTKKRRPVLTDISIAIAFCGSL